MTTHPPAERPDPDDVLACDVLVIGAGVSGYCAAIQAGREGADVILVEKDAVLGGNSGPNVGVHISGADRYHHFSSETGVIGELSEHKAWCVAQTQLSPRAMNYNISRRWEAVVQTALEAAGVRVLKRHYARAPIVEGNRIVAVVVEDIAAFRTRRIDVRHCVVEASGDGEVAARAGASFRTGAEARSELGERSAPDEANALVQGTSLVAIAHNTGHPVPFVPPPDLPPFEPRLWNHHKPTNWHKGWFRPERDLVFLYVTETGGHLDTVRDDGQIYELLLKQLWAEWDDIKNGATADEARDWDLVWVSPKAGKRESRRFLGDYVLTQTDIEAGRDFPDAVTYGGFDIDMHEPHGANADIVSYAIPPLYSIPLRSLYSRDIANLLLAGRLVSVSHIAHASVRVMRTGGAIGQSVGMAAALCTHKACTPRQLAERHIDELRQRLLQADATILHLAHADPTDLAPTARVHATSEETFNHQALGTWLPLDGHRGLIAYDWPAELRTIELYLKNTSPEPQTIELAIAQTRYERPWQHHTEFHKWRWRDPRVERFEEIARPRATVPANFEGWLPVPLPAPLALRPKQPTREDDRLLLALAPSPDLNWGVAARPCEIAVSVERAPDDAEWHARTRPDDTPCDADYPDPAAPPRPPIIGERHMVRLDPAPPVGEAANAVNGYARRFGTAPTNMWVSQRGEPLPQALTLEFPAPVAFDTVHLTFDTLYDDYEDMPHNHGPRAAGMCVKDYRLEVEQGGVWRSVVEVSGNIHRVRVHRIERIAAKSLRLVVLAVHEFARYGARLYQIRVH